MVWQSMNPATEEVLATFEEHSPGQVNALLEEAQTAFSRQAATIGQGSAMMRRLADTLRTQRFSLARIATLEKGKPIVETEVEIDKRAWTRDCYAEHALKLLQAELVESSASPRATSHLNRWRHPGDHALELSVLAGIPLRCACNHGWQYRHPEVRA